MRASELTFENGQAKTTATISNAEVLAYRATIAQDIADRQAQVTELNDELNAIDDFIETNNIS